MRDRCICTHARVCARACTPVSGCVCVQEALPGRRQGRGRAGWVWLLLLFIFSENEHTVHPTLHLPSSEPAGKSIAMD